MIFFVFSFRPILCHYIELSLTIKQDCLHCVFTYHICTYISFPLHGILSLIILVSCIDIFNRKQISNINSNCNIHYSILECWYSLMKIVCVCNDYNFVWNMFLFWTYTGCNHMASYNWLVCLITCLMFFDCHNDDAVIF